MSCFMAHLIQHETLDKNADMNTNKIEARNVKAVPHSLDVSPG